MVAGTTSFVPCITRRNKYLPAGYTSGTTAPVPTACSTGGLHSSVSAHVPKSSHLSTTAVGPTQCPYNGTTCLLMSRNLRTSPHRLWGPRSACTMVPRVCSCPEIFAPVHTDCRAHAVPVQWYHVSFPKRGVDHPRPPSAELKGRLEVFLYSPYLGPRALLTNFAFTCPRPGLFKALSINSVNNASL